MADVFAAPTDEDAIELARTLRLEDRREMAGLGGADVLAHIRYCVEQSEQCWTCHKNGRVLAMFGIVRTNPFVNHGKVWMLASDESARNKVFVGRWTKKIMNAFLEDWDYLYNYIDSGNDDTIAWLKWLGADVKPAQPMGPYGAMYHHFSFTRR